MGSAELEEGNDVVSNGGVLTDGEAEINEIFNDKKLYNINHNPDLYPHLIRS